MPPLTRRLLIDACNAAAVHPDRISASQGRWLVKRAYYYRCGETPEGWAGKVESALRAAGHKVDVTARDQFGRQLSYFVAIVEGGR